MSRTGPNRILRKLTPEDLEKFEPELEEVVLAKGQMILDAGHEVDHVYFPLDSVCAVLAVTDAQSPIEVGMFGSEGMSNMVVRPGDRTFFRTMCFIAGRALRIRAEPFARLLGELRSLNEMTLRYKDAAAIQFGYAAYAHGVFSIEARLARWLLMTADRVHGGDLPVIHDLAASMLSVRRSGVTTAIHVIEGTGAIKATRGLVTIRNREKLEEIAGDCYGLPEQAYESVMGQQPDGS